MVPPFFLTCLSRLNAVDKAMNRETWLHTLAERLAPHFADLGHPIPPFRVAIGFPSAGARGRAVAECWDKSASGDGRFEILIRPDEDDPMEVANSLAHELAHAAAGLACGHKGDFEKICLGLGLLRPMNSTPTGPKFRELLAPHLEAMGPLPHARLNFARRAAPGLTAQPPAGDTPNDAGDNGEETHKAPPLSSAPPKQGTRLIKVSCKECGYTARVARKWLDTVGALHCPTHGAMGNEEGP
ncbi:transcription elongation protein SprT [Nitrospirillum sp. BR 11828]|uniref:transcription elongation protein SprT n=1 Tax=Nitrospirillum sp. BR 11828 TaxID=3104325 RepID=UPI002ACA5EA1|nr:transcription elongation protein SprT [Nitrospirillum sp. BR 11828]MDZ5647159.1 transcription elongation protein SprT [Nitrospirillum sp. BR 11828]